MPFLSIYNIRFNITVSESSARSPSDRVLLSGFERDNQGDTNIVYVESHPGTGDNPNDGEAKPLDRKPS